MKTQLLIAFWGVCLVVQAQSYENDALLYSRQQISGTARTVGVGGAFGAVGADMGSIGVNPAGLGLFRSIDISVTPGLQLAFNDSKFNNSLSTGSRSGLYMGQAGLAWTVFSKKGVSADEISFTAPNRLRSFSFAINYQRQSFFSRNIEYSGLSIPYSNVSGYTDYVNGTLYPLNLDNYSPEVVLLRDAGLIYGDTLSGLYRSGVIGPVDQYGSISTRGAKDEISIAFGGNVSDKLYFGLGIGIPLVTNLQTTSFTESNANAADTSAFNSYTFSTDLRVSGAGFNSSLGLIYRAAPWLRLGVAYYIPTFYAFSEEYAINSDVLLDTAYIPNGVLYSPFKYKLRSPMKGVASAAFFIKQHAFIAVDYEFQNYGAMRYNFGKGYEGFTETVNNSIKQNYTFAHTIRAGVEGAIKWFRVRGGYSFSTSPYKKSYGEKGYRGVRNDITAGLGYKGKRFYADLAYVYSITGDRNAIMAIDYVRNTLSTHRVMITVGWKIQPRNTPK